MREDVVATQVHQGDQVETSNTPSMAREPRALPLSTHPTTVTRSLAALKKLPTLFCGMR